MAAIDLVILGMLQKEALSAYEIQKKVEYRNISRWVKISTPSIYKKVIQLEGKGLIRSTPVKEGNMAEKAVYSLTPDGRCEFERLMLEISDKPVRIFLDLNAVAVNLDALDPEQQEACLSGIAGRIAEMRAYIEKNLAAKETAPGIPEIGLAVLRQQQALAQLLAEWVESLQNEYAGLHRKESDVDGLTPSEDDNLAPVFTG